MAKYAGKGDKADLVNHGNQMNPEHEKTNNSKKR